MPNINNSAQSDFNPKVSIFFGLFILILAVGRTWGLMDEFLVGRFLFFSILGLWALFFIVKQKEYNIQILDVAFIFYYTLTSVSLTWSVLPSAGFFPLQSIGLAYIFYVLFRLIMVKLKLPWIQKMILLGSVLVIGVVIIQLIEIGLTSGISNNNIYEITGWTGHKNLTASILYLLFGLTVYYYFLGKRSIGVGLIMLLQLAVIFILQSRAVVLALFVFLSCIITYSFITKNSVWPSIKFKLIYLLTGAILLGVILFFIFGGTLADIKKLSPDTYMKSASGTERRFVWYKTRQLIKENWIKGYGAGNWKLVFPSKSIEGSYRLQTQNVIFTRAHNDYLEIWAETGIVGLISYLSLFIISFWYIIQKFRSDNKEKRLSTLIPFFLLIGYMIIAFFDFPKERIEHNLMLSLLFALASPAAEEVKKLNFNISFKGNYFRIGYWLLACTLALNCIYSYYLINGEHHIRKAMEAQVINQWQKVEEESKKAYSPFYQINPIATSVKWLEGLALYHQGRFADAEIAFILASRHTPFHFNSLNDYASCLVQLKKYTEAIEIYKKVLFINPRFEDAMFNISFAYSQLKEYDKALEWVQKTKTLPLKKENFIREIEQLRAKDNPLK